MQHGEVDLVIVGTDRVTRTRRRRQQDRHLPEGAGGARQRRAVLGRAAVHHDRLDGVATASRKSRSRSAAQAEVTDITGRTADGSDRHGARRAAGQPGRQSGVRRDAGAAGHRPDHRARPLRRHRRGPGAAVPRTQRGMKLHDRLPAPSVMPVCKYTIACTYLRPHLLASAALLALSRVCRADPARRPCAAVRPRAVRAVLARRGGGDRTARVAAVRLAGG